MYIFFYITLNILQINNTSQHSTNNHNSTPTTSLNLHLFYSNSNHSTLHHLIQQRDHNSTLSMNKMPLFIMLTLVVTMLVSHSSAANGIHNVLSSSLPSTTTPFDFKPSDGGFGQYSSSVSITLGDFPVTAMGDYTLYVSITGSQLHGTRHVLNRIYKYQNEQLK